MTPEERVVIQAAIKFARPSLANIFVLAEESDGRAIHKAVVALQLACNDCHYGKHQCPDCGKDVEHGDVDCGQHDEEWIPSTFRYVVEGDQLRIGRDVAYVSGGGAQEWHADNTNKYEPKRWDHIEVHLTLSLVNETLQLQFPPDTEVDILCDAERKAQLLLQKAFPGTKEVE